MDSWRVRTDPSRVSFVCVRASNTLWDLCEFPIQQTPAFYTRVYLDDSYTFADSHRAFLAHFDCSCRLRYCAKRSKSVAHKYTIILFLSTIASSKTHR